ncbi:tyrosine-type recombinase/integrase [Nocardia wallacei]|uniref:tyrosine-type recombinase/integrase n=1 Tax=Nocardia wallacei TaxID=480035 RepID=UPI002453C487|nr:hypothetical protein [Nocardia wallacei]
MPQVTLEPGAYPPKSKLKPAKGPDGIYRIDRVRHRALSGGYVRTSASGRTQRECLEDFDRNFQRNIRKGSKRQRASRRKTFDTTDKMHDVFEHWLTLQWARVGKGSLSERTYNAYKLAIFVSDNPERSRNPNAFKLDEEMGNLSVAEANDAAYIADYLDEVAESVPNTAVLHFIVLCAVFKMLVQNPGGLDASPMAYVDKPECESAEPHALDHDERVGVWGVILSWLAGGHGRGRYVRMYYLLLLGTGMRPGEGLAVRWCDMPELDDDTVERVVLEVCGTVVDTKTKGLHRQPKRKRGNSYSVLLPKWLTSELRAEKRRVKPKDENETVLKAPRAGGLVSLKSSQQAARNFRMGSPYEWFVWSHLRDTVGTHVAVHTGDDGRASAQLGHSDGSESIAQRHYIDRTGRKRIVVDNADVLELLDPKTGGKLESAPVAA